MSYTFCADMNFVSTSCVVYATASYVVICIQPALCFINPLIARNNFVHENIVFEFANILLKLINPTLTSIDKRSFGWIAITHFGLCFIVLRQDSLQLISKIHLQNIEYKISL